MRLAPALAAFALSFAVLLPGARSLPQHWDEADYAWSAGYYGSLIARWDWRWSGPHAILDPGWSPRAYWAQTQPMGARLLYAAALALAGEPPIAPPWQPAPPRAALPVEVAPLPARTLAALRLASVLCAAAGLALIARRLGWPGLATVGLLLAIPHARTELALGIAETTSRTP